MMVIRDGDRVRLISRGGVDFARRFPWIVEAPHKQFVIDGETVLLVSQGTSDLHDLHSNCDTGFIPDGAERTWR